MKNPLNLIAFDLGSSNGRAFLGCFDGKKIKLEEVHRFENNYVQMGEMIYWDILHIFSNIKTAFAKYSALYKGELACFGIDGWGNDYGLIDKNGHLLSNARCARHTTDLDMRESHKILSGRDIFFRSGNSSYSINTLYQLHRRLREGDPAIENAHAMLMIPDLLSFFCTGEKHSEYTISTTTAMYNPTLNDWDRKMLSMFNINERILMPILPSGTLCGELLSTIAAEAYVNRVPYALVGSHDTASAVASIPAKTNDNYAFCSSGTWSILGIETEAPIFTNDMYDSNFSNEGTVQGGYRPLVNITGLWIIQEARKEWKKNGKDLSYTDITNLVMNTPALQSFIDPSHSDFFNVVNMPLQIQNYCKRTNQPIPDNEGAIARCVYESLALKYRWAIERLEIFSGKNIDRLYIVGGGIRNEMLNQMIADCIGRPVTTGPIEGACVGNLLMQCLALGEISDIFQMREIVRNSFVLTEYEPSSTKKWDDAYHRFLKIQNNDQNSVTL
ncbi:MAG: rhamnulokinase [Christensenellales bacterium]|jgi:rhamnulokinase